VLGGFKKSMFSPSHFLIHLLRLPPLEQVLPSFFENFVASEVANQFGHKLLKETLGYFSCCFFAHVKLANFPL
jgi:hypothetical protein